MIWINKIAEEDMLFEYAYPIDVSTQSSFTSISTGLR